METLQKIEYPVNLFCKALQTITFSSRTEKQNWIKKDAVKIGFSIQTVKRNSSLKIFVSLIFIVKAEEKMTAMR